jgi:hypothetical protein
MYTHEQVNRAGRGWLFLFCIALFFSAVAHAHRSGCHRWHSCPSDRGTYECGDVGYCSDCPDNQYCQGGQPRTRSSLQKDTQSDQTERVRKAQKQLSTPAQNPDADLSKLSPTARNWVNRSCPRSLGPSLWASCIVRESSAASLGKPDLSSLKRDLQAWVTRSCPDSLGPSLTISCLNRGKVALSAGLPNVSSLTEEQKQWVLDTCPRSLGPSLFVSCVQREWAAFRGKQSVP